jgi:hypothetical protein
MTEGPSVPYDPLNDEVAAMMGSGDSRLMPVSIEVCYWDESEWIHM